MKAAQPWLKFYPQDWRADEKLRMCSLAARGLWIEMLALMHRSERYGQLLIAGIVPNDAQIAIQVGASQIEVTAMLFELEKAGVFSRAATGAIYSRRMNRDEKRAKTARRNGKAGGNPTLKKQTENPVWDKGKVKPPDKGGLKPQRPEARIQILESIHPTNGSPPRAHEAGSPPLLERCFAAAGWRPPTEAKRVSAMGDLDGWMDSNFDFEEDILPGIARALREKSGKTSSLRRFTTTIAAVHGERVKLSVPVSVMPRLDRSGEGDAAEALRAALKKHCGKRTYDGWIAPARFDFEERKLTVVAASRFMLDWIRTHFSEFIEREARKIVGAGAMVDWRLPP